MKIHHVEQGTQEWRDLRCGIPTASCFDRILTPTGKPSAQAVPYMHELLAERIMGHEADSYESAWMSRGKELEDEAIRYYEMLTDTTTDPGGFVTADDGRAGCSPDRLVYATGEHDRPIGGLEIKCPKPGTHIGYLLNGTHAERTYRHQSQGCMWICGLEWWDILSYHPELPPALVRVEVDLEWRDAFEPLIADFLADLDAATRKIEGMGYSVGERFAAKEQK